MTVEEARQMTANLNTTLEQYIKEIDEKIKSVALTGGRVITINKGAQYNKDLTRHYTQQGFEVHHYISPWNEVTISW